MHHKKNNLKLAIILSISTMAHSLCLATGVYLENNYGATLNYKISALQPEGQRIGNNVRVFVGDINFIPELSIRTTGTGSSYVSYYYDLGYMLNEIKLNQSAHPNQDAIISVNPSRVSWHVTYSWETKGRIKPFEYTDLPREQAQPTPEKPIEMPIKKEQPVQPKKESTITPSTPAEVTDGNRKKEEELMELKTADQRLYAIKNGSLGTDFAQKAKEICDANYTQAEKLGKINLCSELKRSLVAPVYRVDARAKKKGIVQPDLAPAIDEIKASINRLHGALGRYKTRGEATE